MSRGGIVVLSKLWPRLHFVAIDELSEPSRFEVTEAVAAGRGLCSDPVIGHRGPCTPS